MEHTKGPRRDGGYGGGGGGGRSKCLPGRLNSFIHCSDSVTLRGGTFFAFVLGGLCAFKKHLQRVTDTFIHTEKVGGVMGETH